MGPAAIETLASRVAVFLGSQHYRVLLGAGLLKQIGPTVGQNLRRETCAIITDSNMAPLFATSVEESLASAGLRPTLITIAAGEMTKPIGQMGELYDTMFEAEIVLPSFSRGF